MTKQLHPPALLPLRRCGGVGDMLFRKGMLVGCAFFGISAAALPAYSQNPKPSRIRELPPLASQLPEAPVPVPARTATDPAHPLRNWSFQALPDSAAVPPTPAPLAGTRLQGLPPVAGASIAAPTAVIRNPLFQPGAPAPVVITGPIMAPEQSGPWPSGAGATLDLPGLDPAAVAVDPAWLPPLVDEAAGTRLPASPASGPASGPAMVVSSQTPRPTGDLPPSRWIMPTESSEGTAPPEGMRSSGMAPESGAMTSGNALRDSGTDGSRPTPSVWIIQDNEGEEAASLEPELRATDKAVAQSPEQTPSATPASPVPNSLELQEPAGPAANQNPSALTFPDTIPETSSGLSNSLLPESPLEGEGTERWWHRDVAGQVIQQPQSLPIDVCSLVVEGLRSSRRIQALSQEPLIREAEISIAQADFDPGLFARTLYDDRVDPVGNTLTTGGLPFLKDNIWSGEAGFKQRLTTGGDLRVSQTLGFHNSNSRFFSPQDQGTATLAINFQQPLMRGRGEYINRSQIFLAETATAEASEEFATKLQQELNEIVTAYWTLYANRAQLVQRKRNYELGLAVLKRLEGRANFDALPLQLAQARAAVTSRETAIANARRDVLIAEAEIRRLLTAAHWNDWQRVELLTVEPPLAVPELSTMEQTVYLALENRPEIRQGTQRVKAAGIRSNVAANQLLPELKLLFGTYVSALEGDSGIERAWARQFNGSTPGFSGGFQYDFPWRNRAARGKHQQAELELTRSQLELEQITVNVIVDAQQSWYRLQTAHERLAAGLEAMKAARAELEQNEQRWENAAIVEGDWSDGQTQSLILDQLLLSQQKLLEAERVVVESEQETKLAQVNLKRATGTLLGFCQGIPSSLDFQSPPRADLPVSSSGPSSSGSTNGNATAPGFSPGEQGFQSPLQSSPEMNQPAPGQPPAGEPEKPDLPPAEEKPDLAAF